MGLSYSEDPMIVAGVVFDTVPAIDGQTKTDRRTDGQTDGCAIANTALSITSNADAL